MIAVVCLAEVARLLDLLAEKDVLLADAEGHRAQAVAHAPVRDHVAGQRVCLLEIHLGAGRTAGRRSGGRRPGRP